MLQTHYLFLVGNQSPNRKLAKPSVRIAPHQALQLSTIRKISWGPVAYDCTVLRLLAKNQLVKSQLQREKMDEREKSEKRPDTDVIYLLN